MLTRKRTIAYRKWTPDETEQLFDLIQEGLKGPEIAARLHRTPQAVNTRLMQLGVAKKNRVMNKKCVLMTTRVTEDFHKRFRRFCRERAGNFGDTIELVMESFMNQVEEAERNRRRKLYEHPDLPPLPTAIHESHDS